MGRLTIRASSPGRPAEAAAAGRPASAADLRDFGRPAEGRSLRFLRPGHARPSSKLDPVDADHSAAWKGTAVHEVLEDWLAKTIARRELLAARAEASSAKRIHPMLRALWHPRLIEAIRWIEAAGKGQPRERPASARGRDRGGETKIGGVVVHGKADRIDRLPTAGWRSSIIRPGKAPAQKAVDARVCAAARLARPDRPGRRIRRA